MQVLEEGSTVHAVREDICLKKNMLCLKERSPRSSGCVKIVIYYVQGGICTNRELFESPKRN